MEQIVILIVDGSEIFRAGFCKKLATQSEFKILDCDPGCEPLSLIEANSVNVVLLDIVNPNRTGLEQGKEISCHYPNTRVIIMSPYFNDEELFETIKIGASAYLDKQVGINELINVIKRASRGEYPINDFVMSTPVVASRVLAQFREMSSLGLNIEKVVAPLTNREIQILTYISRGNTNKQIGFQLGISEQTIKNHVSAILRKLNALDRAHAVALAIKHQWVPIP